MRFSIVLIIISIWLTGCSQKYYIVRHAEKAVPGNAGNMAADDPPLSEAGTQRAKDLAVRLSPAKIGYVFSTNRIRTLTTAGPTASNFGLQTETYDKIDAAFIQKLKGLKKNVLIVGHSNTVDELVNSLTGKSQLTDLPDTSFDNLFIVTRKGKKWVFSAEKYGQPSP